MSGARPPSPAPGDGAGRAATPDPAGRSRGLGSPALFAIASTAVSASVFFALGVVAGNALGLTPVVFVLAGAFFVVTMLTYVEGSSLHPERGGASAFARYGFNELWSFIAGWAILLDFVIVMAIASLSISHYLAAFWDGADARGAELLIAAAAIGVAAFANVRGLTADGLRVVLRIGLLSLVLFSVVMLVGLVDVFDAGLIVDSVDLGTAPEWDDLVFAAVVATVAVTGIESASGLAGDIRVGRRALKRSVVVGTAAVFTLFVGIPTIALMAVPVQAGVTELGGRFLEAPVLGVVSGFDPVWLSDVLRAAVGAVGAVVLFQALNGGMLGVSRLAYTLATNRQIPSATGKLHPRRSTPYVAIGIAALLAFTLVLVADVEFLLGIFAFGAMLAVAIAHLSVIALRFREPSAPRAFAVPLSIPLGGGGSLPVPAVLGALAAIAGWVSVIVLHEGARIIGGLWMLAGVLLFVIYRKSQGKPLTRRFTIPARVLQEGPDVEYRSILVPVFGAPLDDDIVGTAGRLAGEEEHEGDGVAEIEAIYVLEVPMSLPLDARLPDELLQAARRALARAKEVGEEYEDVEVRTATVRGRMTGATIVEEARRRGVEAIVMAAEEPTRTRGGALLGGTGGPRDRFVGSMTRFVVEKAACRVILTVPPAGEDPQRNHREGSDGGAAAEQLPPAG